MRVFSEASFNFAECKPMVLGMSLVVLTFALILCSGFAALLHAMKTAPEGAENANGFDLQITPVKVRTYLHPSGESQATATHVPRTTAA